MVWYLNYISSVFIKNNYKKQSREYFYTSTAPPTHTHLNQRVQPEFLKRKYICFFNRRIQVMVLQAWLDINPSFQPCLETTHHVPRAEIF